VRLQRFVELSLQFALLNRVAPVLGAPFLPPHLPWPVRVCDCETVASRQVSLAVHGAPVLQAPSLPPHLPLLIARSEVGGHRGTGVRLRLERNGVSKNGHGRVAWMGLDGDL
jgi:hypothetical protein